MLQIGASVLLLTAAVLQVTNAQFPAECNNAESLTSKTCCPKDCSGSIRGTCKNITASVKEQWTKSNQIIVEIIKNSPNEKPDKGTIDSRYLWPTLVFENVCECNGHYGGADCSECDFGWAGEDCNDKKEPVIRKAFGSLSATEKTRVANATLGLKNEMGYWSIIVGEPEDYDNGETVQLQNVSTYNFFIYLHNFVARGGNSQCTKTVNKNQSIDFAHSGPVFPVWHRRYILTVEKEFQRYLEDPTFGLPYWKWEENSMAPFDFDYYGEPGNSYTIPAINVSGRVINPSSWNTVCDIRYWKTTTATCQELWKACDPAKDLADARPLQRGPNEPDDLYIYLPDKVEVMIALAAPAYDAPDKDGQYFRNSPRTSFRSRLEGWNIICSKGICFYTSDNTEYTDHMHNLVHDWVGGQMDIVPAAVNDPIFNFHHCNVDRILESWMKRFTPANSNISSELLLPPYIPISGTHPGHNRDDYMVPFFPLVKPGEQYKPAEDWGYTYDNLIDANIPDADIPFCNGIDDDLCPICSANTTCIDCRYEVNQTCPAFKVFTPITPDAGGISGDGSKSQLKLGLGLGIPVAVGVFTAGGLTVVVILFRRKRSSYNVSRVGSTRTGREEVDIGEPQEEIIQTSRLIEEIEEAETET